MGERPRLQAKPSGDLLQQAGVRRGDSRPGCGLFDESEKWAPSRVMQTIKQVTCIQGEDFRRLQSRIESTAFRR